METKAKYYTPSLEEFKQGFKFEKRYEKKGDYIGSIIIWDFSNDANNEEIKIYAKKDRWVKFKVNWDRPAKMKTIKHGECTITYLDLPEPMYNLEKLLKDGRIRAKR